MPSLTLSISNEFNNQLKEFIWVNWSEIAREEIIKKLIFENYIKTGDLSDEEWAFCEKIDWHPVDELPLKEEFKREIEKRFENSKNKIKELEKEKLKEEILIRDF